MRGIRCFLDHNPLFPVRFGKSLLYVYIIEVRIEDTDLRNAIYWKLISPCGLSDSFWGRPIVDAIGFSALLLDGCSDEAAPLCPGAIVVANVGIAQQGVQHEPGVATAFPDATIGDHLFVGSDAMACIQRAQFLRRLEGAIFPHGHRPGNIDRPWNVPASLRPLLMPVGRSEQLPAEFARRAHIHQGTIPTPKREQDLVPEGADTVARGLCCIAGR